MSLDMETEPQVPLRTFTVKTAPHPPHRRRLLATPALALLLPSMAQASLILNDVALTSMASEPSIDQGEVAYLSGNAQAGFGAVAGFQEVNANGVAAGPQGIVAQAGVTLVPNGGGATFDSFSSVPSVRAGDIAFVGSWTDLINGVRTSVTGIYLATPTGGGAGYKLSTIADTLTPVPLSGGGSVTFGPFSLLSDQPSLNVVTTDPLLPNHTSYVAVVFSPTDYTATGEVNDVIYKYTSAAPGALSVVAQAGTVVSGDGVLAKLTSFGPYPTIAGDGTVFMDAQATNLLTGKPDQGIFQSFSSSVSPYLNQSPTEIASQGGGLPNGGASPSFECSPTASKSNSNYYFGDSFWTAFVAQSSTLGASLYLSGPGSGGPVYVASGAGCHPSLDNGLLAYVGSNGDIYSNLGQPAYTVPSDLSVPPADVVPVGNVLSPEQLTIGGVTYTSCGALGFPVPLSGTDIMSNEAVDAASQTIAFRTTLGPANWDCGPAVTGPEYVAIVTETYVNDPEPTGLASIALGSLVLAWLRWAGRHVRGS